MNLKLEGIFICMLLLCMIFSNVGAISIYQIKNKMCSSMDARAFYTSGDVVDDVGWYTSLALDDNGFPHISYYDYTNGDLKYAKYTGSSWTIEKVDGCGNVGRYTSMVLDDNGYPHISYYDYTNGDLKYAKYTGDSWSIKKVDRWGNVGLYTSIALDSDGNPHISYCDYSKRALKYAYWTGFYWGKKIVDNTCDICMYEYFSDYTSIALDSNDHPHISYCDFGNWDLKYAYWTGSKWEIGVVDDDGDVGQYSSLVLDQNDNPHISYAFWMKGGINFDLKYAKRTADIWDIENVDEEGDVRKWTSIKLDINGYPHISYYDYTEGALKYTYWNGSSWHKETVETNGSTGCFNSLALDGNKQPHISYYDWGKKALKYVSFSNNEWDIQTIEFDTNTDFIDQEQNYCCGFANEISDDHPVAQSIIPTYPVLTRVELMAVRRYNPGALTVSIRENLNGEDLTSIYISRDEIAEDMSWKNCDFQDIEVNTNQTYYIVCTSEDTEDLNTFWWYFGIHNPYQDGCGWIKDTTWKVLTSSPFPEMDLGFKTFGLNTQIPDTPTFTGPTSGRPLKEYTYKVQSSDPDNDDLYYYIDWGDDTEEKIGPYVSDKEVTVTHRWLKRGTYLVQAKAIDIHGAESGWIGLEVTMPKNKISTNSLLIKLIEIFPYMFPILRNILGAINLY